MPKVKKLLGEGGITEQVKVEREKGNSRHLHLESCGDIKLA